MNNLMYKAVLIGCSIFIGFLFLNALMNYLDLPVVVFDAISGECIRVNVSPEAEIQDIDCNDIDRVIFRYVSVKI